MSVWLLKTEPSDFSFEDLVARGVEPWDGVRNPQALRNIAAAREGEMCVIYHTGDERQAVGLATVVRAGYPDPADARLTLIDVRAGERLPSPPHPRHGPPTAPSTTSSRAWPRSSASGPSAWS